eukprot:1195370-Prorocentrum_minimum.AAC.4
MTANGSNGRKSAALPQGFQQVTIAGAADSSLSQFISVYLSLSAVYLGLSPVYFGLSPVYLGLSVDIMRARSALCFASGSLVVKSRQPRGDRRVKTELIWSFGGKADLVIRGQS